LSVAKSGLKIWLNKVAGFAWLCQLGLTTTGSRTTQQVL
jgi:hypothetical protein